MHRIETKPTRLPMKPSTEVFRNEQGVIDLASIMVGIIVIGMIGGVIAATVFAVIPWAQDAAAKQQLDNIVTAESAYMGYSATTPSLLPAGSPTNSYGYSNELEAANVLIQGKTYCVIPTPDRKGFDAYAQSASGKVFTASDRKTKPEIYSSSLPSACAFIADGFPTPPPPPYVDPTPKLTKLTYQCPTARTGAIPMNGTLTGTETWSDGVTVTYTGAANPTSRNLDAGTVYTVTFDGTYKFFNSGNLQGCLRSLDHWGMETGAISGMSAFSSAALLTSVPEHIPPTVTRVEGMFSGATIFNDPNISKWDMSNVTSTFQMFINAKAFNQPLNNWNTSKMTDIGWMFYGASAFNQPLNKWDVSNVTNMSLTFNDAAAFNQDINSWNVSKVVMMNGMFFGAVAFDKPLNSWNISNVTATNGMFTNAKVFNQPLNNWNTSKVTQMQGMFNDAKAFNQNIDSWNVSNVGNMSAMFMGATTFNQPLNSWTLTKATNTTYMFNSATAFNQPLNNWVMTSVNDTQFMFQNATSFNQNINSWDVSNVTNMSSMFDNADAFNEPLDNWKVGNVVRFTSMFQNTAAFNKNINTWNTSKAVQVAFMFRDAAAYDQPMNNWDMTKASNIGFMFYNAPIFTQDLSGWNLAAISGESRTTFVRAGFPTTFLPPKVT